MVKKIEKRDGRKVAYQEKKVLRAITKAVRSVYSDEDVPDEIMKELEGVAHNVTEKVDIVFDGDIPNVEQVQDIVEQELISADLGDVAKEYILYRAERTKKRELNADLMKMYEDLTFKDSKDNNDKRENANIDADAPMGVMLKYGSEGAKHYNLLRLLDDKTAKMFKNGDIHIHDFDFYALTETCCQIDLKKLFKGGFCTGHGFESEPKSIGTYVALACIAIQSNQNDMHGGQALPKFDYDMAKGVSLSYIKWIVKIADIKFNKDLSNVKEVLFKYMEDKDHILNKAGSLKIEELLLKEGIEKEDIKGICESALKYTEEETHQAMQALITNLNTMHSRAGSQVPFSSLNLGTDTSKEGRMVTKNFLLATEEGLGNGETPIFPISIFKVKEGINYNETDPNYDLFKLACRVSAKRLFPNFSFIDAPYNLKYYKEGNPDTEIAYMGCRTRTIANVYDPTNEIVTGRGNLSFTSINLPRLGITAKGDINKFFKNLDKVMEVVHQQLLSRFRIQAAKKVRNYPFLMGQGVWLGSENLEIDDTVGEVLKQGSLTVGFIGLAETLKALIGKHHGESEEAQKLGLEIIGHMRELTDKWSEAEHLNYAVLGTPAESLSGRFVKIDRKKFGKIAGVTDKEWYTNSSHIPVEFPITAARKIALEAPYHALENGGHIAYVELDGDPCKNLEAFEDVIRCMKECGVGYGAINHPVDRDPVCGYVGIIGDVCPRCGRRVGEELSEEKIAELKKKYSKLPSTLY